MQHIRLMGKGGKIHIVLMQENLYTNTAVYITNFCSTCAPTSRLLFPAWNTGFIGDVRPLEAVQRKWTKKIVGFLDLPYSD